MPKNYKLLKGIVITLGILIVVMVVVIIVAAINQYNEQKSAEASLVQKYEMSEGPISSVMRPFEMDLNLEDGEQVIATSSSERGILVTIGKKGEVSKILLIDYRGKITGTINVN